MSSYGTGQEPDVSSSTDISISDNGLTLWASFNLNSLLSEYPFSQYSHNGSWGSQHWNFEESSSVIVTYVFFIRIHAIFFKMEFQYVARGGLKLNPSASAFGILGF